MPKKNLLTQPAYVAQLNLLRRKNGATIAQICEARGGLKPHTVRGMISNVRKAGVAITRAAGSRLMGWRRPMKGTSAPCSNARLVLADFTLRGRRLSPSEQLIGATRGQFPPCLLSQSGPTPSCARSLTAAFF
jgi:hypothetical protein